jgi:VWFA-related protein
MQPVHRRYAINLFALAPEAAMLYAALAAALSVSGTAPQQPRTLPEFRSDVRVLRLDVSVVDGRGQPVAGLEPEDFLVLEDGRPVRITFFEAVADGGSATDEQGEGLIVSAPPSRRVLLLVDTGAMSTAQLFRARQSAARYLREAAAEGDWVRLVNLSTGRAWDGRMPHDRARLESAALSLARRGSPWADLAAGDGSMFDAIQDRVEVDAQVGAPSETETAGQFLSAFAQGSGLLGVLEALLVQLDGLEGRKAVVLLSPGFPSLRGLDERLQRVSTLARDAATAIYFVDAAGLDGLEPVRGKLPPAFESAWRRSGGAQDLAEATGGFTARFANSLFPALRRVAAELRTYYVLGYVPPRPDDGRFRAVKVKVNVRGLTARTKKGYLAGRRR